MEILNSQTKIKLLASNSGIISMDPPNELANGRLVDEGEGKTESIQIRAKAGAFIVRQTYTKIVEKRITTDSQDVVPTGPQSCNNSGCTEVINTWQLVTAEPLFLKNPRFECIDSYKNSCKAGHVDIDQKTPQYIQFVTRTRSRWSWGHPTFRLLADLYQREKQEKIYIVPNQDFYYDQDFHIEIAKGVTVTELIGNHNEHGSFLIDPLKFQNGFGFTKTNVVDHPGGKRITFHAWAE